MSSTIVASVISILAILLPQFGVELGSEQLTQILSGLAVIISSLWVWFQRTTLQKAPLGAGDVNLLGVRK